MCDPEGVFVPFLGEHLDTWTPVGTDVCALGGFRPVLTARAAGTGQAAYGQHLLPHGSGGWKSQVQVSARLVASEASVLGF